MTILTVGDNPENGHISHYPGRKASVVIVTSDRSVGGTVPGVMGPIARASDFDGAWFDLATPGKLECRKVLMKTPSPWQIGEIEVVE